MKYVYEFIGTFFLLFTIGMVVIGENAPLLLAPLAIGSVLAVFIYAGGHISGGHYNPAVSLSIFLRGMLRLPDLIIYWIVQFAGALVAAYTVIYLKGAGAPSALNPDVYKALLAEFLFTFALCYVVLNAATARETIANSFFGFAIGFTVLAGAYAVGSISGAAFNPAVALGVSVLNLSAWHNLWIYFVANFAGAILAAVIFKLAHPSEA
ncbi:MAG: MIP/aquaporin family protein [Parachlamydiaceae bacterium]